MIALSVQRRAHAVQLRSFQSAWMFMGWSALDQQPACCGPHGERCAHRNVPFAFVRRGLNAYPISFAAAPRIPLDRRWREETGFINIMIMHGIAIPPPRENSDEVHEARQNCYSPSWPI